MRKILQTIIFLFSISIFACECDPPKIAEKYIQSDFVANVTITKIYPNKNNEQVYRADIEINDLYKGQRLESIYVYGRNGNGIRTSCDIFIPVNTKLIAYAEKNESGNYVVGMCSGLLYLNNSNLNKQRLELKILKTFVNKGINFTSKIRYLEKGDFSKNLFMRELQDYKGVKLENDFGFYEITFSSNLTIKSVLEISGFDNPIDQKLIGLLKNTSWESYNNGVKNQVPENSRFIIGIHYYKADKNNRSFLSLYYL